MNLNEYQEATEATAVYPTDGNIGILYCALKLASEAGEFTGKIGKALRDNTGLDKEALVLELGDVLWYVARAAGELGYSLENVAAANLAKLTDRASRGVLGGSGDYR